MKSTYHLTQPLQQKKKTDHIWKLVRKVQAQCAFDSLHDQEEAEEEKREEEEEEEKQTHRVWKLVRKVQAQHATKRTQLVT